MVTEKTTGLSTEWFKKRLDFLKGVKEGREYTAGEAKAEFDIDIEPDWKVKPEATTEGVKFNYVSPEGWVFKNITEDDYLAVSPTGEEFTRAEYEAPRMVPQDIEAAERRFDLGIAEQFPGEAVPPERAEAEQRRAELGIAEAFPGEAPPPEILEQQELRFEEQRETLRNAAAVLSNAYRPETTYTPAQVSDVLRNLRGRAKADPADFVGDLYLRTGQENAEDVLRLLGVPEDSIQNISRTALEEDVEGVKAEEAIQAVFPGFSAQDLANLIDENPSLFFEKLQTGNSRKDKEALLRRMGASSQQIAAILRFRNMQVSVDGETRRLSVDLLNNVAYDEDGNFAGRFNPATGEFTEAEPESVAKDFFDALLMTSRRALESAQTIALTTLPELFSNYLMMTPFPEDVEKQVAEAAKQELRQLYVAKREGYEEWLLKNPELRPTKEYEEGALQHPELLKDWKYWSYETANILPYIGTTAIIAAATGGVGVAAMAGTAGVMSVVEGGALQDELLDAGAPSDRSAEMSAVGGLLMGALEAAGRLPLLRQLSPLLMRQFKRIAGKELVRRGFKETVKRFGWNFTVNQFAEVSTEVMQEVVSNTAVSFFDENRSVFDNLPDIAVKTAVAMAGPGMLGAGVSVMQVSPSITQNLTDAQMKARGWIKDVQTSKWYQTISGERGGIELPFGEEPVSPEIAKVDWAKTPITARNANELIQIVKSLKTESGGLKRGMEAFDPALKTLSEKDLFAVLEYARGETPFIHRFFGAHVADEIVRRGLTVPAPTTPAVEVTIPEITREQIMVGEGVDAITTRQLADGTFQVTPSYNQVSRGFERKIFKTQEEAKAYISELQGKPVTPTALEAGVTPAEAARRQAEEAPEEAREAYEAYAEAEGLKAYLEIDPVAQHRVWVGKSKKGKDLYRGLDWFISLREGNFPSYFTLKQARLLKPGGNFTAWTQKGTKEYNRVPREVVLDELADSWGMTPEEVGERVMQIREEKRRIKGLEAEMRTQIVEPSQETREETIEQETARLAEQVRAKLALEEQQASVEATLEANREKRLELVTKPRQEGEIPRQTVRHPSHYRGMDDFNVEIKKELLTAIPEVPLDVAATEYLKTGDFARYIENMPDASELKLAALTGEVHTAVEELTELRRLAVEELTDVRARKADALEIEFSEETVRVWDALIEEAQAKQDLFGGLIDKARVKQPLTVDDAVALGIALRRTKGGKLVPAVRRSGFYVTNEFVDSPYLQDVPYQQGFWEDVDSLFEHIDGGRAAGTPDAPAVAQKYIQRPSQRNFLAYKSFLDAKFQEAQDIFQRFGLTGRVGKEKWTDVFNTIEQITAAEAGFKTAQVLRKPEIASILAKYDKETRANIVEFAQWARAFLDGMRDIQNQARAKRQQKPIGYIDKYLSWVVERNIWSSLGFQQRTPADFHQAGPAPDYILPDAPFNARAMTREGGMKNYTLERDVHKLLFDYIRTAGKDIFFTNTVQNNKIHIAALKARGLKSTATLLEEYNGEVWAGAKPRITKAYEAFLPKGIAKATYVIRRNLTRNVFPLNWIWNITIQPSSLAFTAGRTGFVNLAKGMDFLYSPSARAFGKEAYSYVIKSKRAGMMAFQDIGTQVEADLQFEGSLIDKAEYYASFITNTLESLLTGISIRAGYYKGLKLGFKGQDLVEYASKMGAKTQSMYNMQNMPAVLRSKAVGALFPFQTFTIQAMNYVREMNFIRKGKAGAYQTISAKTADGKATISGRLALTASFLVTIMVINMVVDRLTNRKPWIVSSFIPMFAILQAGLQPYDAWYLPLPAKYVNDFWRGFSDAIKYDNLSRLKRWVLQYHFPFAGSQINRMLDGVEAVVRGQLEDVRGRPKFEVLPDEWLKAVFMGPYQTEGGREYIDRLEESREERAKWYEYLRIPILIERVDVNAEIKENLAKLGEVDEDGMRYDFGDFASAIRDIRQSVGLRRFEKSVSPILDGFRKAEASRENYESLPPEKIINMDEYDIAGFLFPDPDSKEKEAVALWTRFNEAKTKDDRVAVITEFIEANKEDLKDNELVKNFDLLQDYWSLTGEDKKEFANHYEALSKNWRSDWRHDNPEDDALLAMWGYGGKIQTQEAYDFIIKWSKEYGVDTAHLSTWLPPEGSEENYFKYQQEVLNRSWNSWEAQLILAKDDNLREALGFDPIDTPMESLELKVKNREHYDAYDALETDEEREQYKADNPEWTDDLRRIEAIENAALDFFKRGIPPQPIGDEWILRPLELPQPEERPTTQAEIRHLELVARGLTASQYQQVIDEWIEGHPDEMEEYLRMGQRFAGFGWIENPMQFVHLEVGDVIGMKVLDLTSEKAHELSDRFSPGVRGRIKGQREAMGSNAIVEGWVERGKTADEFGPSSAEAMVWLLDNPEVYQWAIDNELLSDREAELREREPVLRLNVQFREQDEQYDALATAAERDAFLQENPAYYEARYRRKAYEKDVPENFHVPYIEWYTSPDLKKPDDWEDRTGQDRWYEDDWYLMEHPEFHQMLVEKGIFKQPKTFENVPTKEVFKLWLEYNRIAADKREERMLFRVDHPELDKWGNQVGIWGAKAEPPKEKEPTPPAKPERGGQTPSEGFRERLDESLENFREWLENLG